MRTKTSAIQAIRYDHLKGTKNTPKASRCMMANGVAPITEMCAPFGRGIDNAREAEAIRRNPPQVRSRSWSFDSPWWSGQKLRVLNVVRAGNRGAQRHESA